MPTEHLNSTPKVTIVCCQHGDEPFGKEVFDFFSSRSKLFPQLKIILANPEALALGSRFIEEDLNRAFPGSVEGTHESKLAYSLNQEIKGCDYLLDIHTTLSNIRMTPIVTVMNDAVKRIINACDSREVAFMTSPMAKQSLIGQINNGVSLEFGLKYSKRPEALEEAVSIISRLLEAAERTPKKRKIFFIDDVMPKNGSVELPARISNFRKVTALGVYPFLFHRNSYPTIYCHTASRFKNILI
jgi:succinylglutamate desuccinylase